MGNGNKKREIEKNTNLLRLEALVRFLSFPICSSLILNENNIWHILLEKSLNEQSEGKLKNNVGVSLNI